LEVCGVLPCEHNAKAKELLDRIVAMLTRLGQRGYSVRETASGYPDGDGEADTDSAADPR
jgi:glutamate synthase domain-containing protein 1